MLLTCETQARANVAHLRDASESIGISFIDSFIHISARCNTLYIPSLIITRETQVVWCDWYYTNNGSLLELAYNDFIISLRGYKRKIYFFRQ